MSERKNEAAWVESRGRWQINVQADGIRRTFSSRIAGRKGKIEAEKKADKWLEDRTVGENTRCGDLLDKYLLSTPIALQFSLVCAPAKCSLCVGAMLTANIRFGFVVRSTTTMS